MFWKKKKVKKVVLVDECLRHVIRPVVEGNDVLLAAWYGTSDYILLNPDGTCDGYTQLNGIKVVSWKKFSGFEEK